MSAASIETSMLVFFKRPLMLPKEFSIPWMPLVVLQKGDVCVFMPFAASLPLSVPPPSKKKTNTTQLKLQER
jgi:hypothetical protein